MDLTNGARRPMLNHIYGVIGIGGTLITILTSFLKDNTVSEWMLTCSGWLAALLVGIATHLVIKRQMTFFNQELSSISKVFERTSCRLIDESKQKTVEIKKLVNELSSAKNERDSLRSISAYLASTKVESQAIPRARSSSEFNIEQGE